MSREKCQYGKCTNNRKDCPQLRFFRFPTSPSRTETWVQHCKNDRLLLLTKETIVRLSVCEIHFKSKSFARPNLHDKLLRTAIPTLDEPEQHTEDMPEPQQPGNPIPASVILPTAIKPTRLRQEPKPKSPCYEDLTLILPKIQKVQGEIKCRLCMGVTKVPLLPIFKSSTKPPLVTKIYSVTGLHMEEGDGLPEHICQPCNKNIVNWYQFKQLCLASDEKYRGYKQKKCYVKRKVHLPRKKNDSENVEEAVPIQVCRDDDDNASDIDCETYSGDTNVKVEIEEHSVYDSTTLGLSSTYVYQDVEESSAPPEPCTPESLMPEEVAPPQFVNVKVELAESESVWNPDKGLQVDADDGVCSKHGSSDACMKGMCDISTMDCGVETPLADPLSLTSSHSEITMAIEGVQTSITDPLALTSSHSEITTAINVPPPVSLVSVVKPVTISLDKSSSYLLPLESMPASFQASSGYMLKLAPPLANNCDPFQRRPSVSTDIPNVPVIKNVHSTRTILNQHINEAVPVRKRSVSKVKDDCEFEKKVKLIPK